MVPESDVINVIEQPTSGVLITSKQMSNKQSTTNKKNNIAALKEKISRTSEFLQQLKVLSAGCQELDSAQPEKDKEIFSRRTIQVGAEIRDARDLLSSICKDRLPYRQWKLLFETDSSDLDEQLGFDMDPSVQFFGIDWERVFGRCFSLSMHANLLESTLALQDSIAEEPISAQTIKSNDGDSNLISPELDLVRVNKMLKELAAIEADVLSHSEAVLRGRLSKSQRQLIFDEQNKYAPLTTSTSISKSKSFRDSKKGSRPMIKYRKNKTTNLDKLTSSMSAHTIRCGEGDSNPLTSSGDDNDILDEQTNSLLSSEKKSTLVSMSNKSGRKLSTGGNGNNTGNNNSTSSGFMQNMTSMFKNIR